MGLAYHFFFAPALGLPNAFGLGGAYQHPAPPPAVVQPAPAPDPAAGLRLPQEQIRRLEDMMKGTR